jgi:hypothetical protein
MDDWTEDEVRKVSRTWTDKDGHTWIVVFDLANLQGRVECVGMALRSHFGPLYDVRHPSPELPEDGAVREWIDYLEMALNDVPPLGDGRLEPRPLRAGTLRQLKLVEELRNARADHAADLRQYGEHLRQHPESWATPEDFEAAADVYTNESGRAPRISATHKLLERVAGVYQDAWREGEEPPNTAVRRKLQSYLKQRVTATQARKLVEKCRKTDPPLLPPADRRVARGWLKGDPGIPARFDEWSTDAKRKDD